MELVANTKVCNLDASVLTEQQVGRFDIAVDDMLEVHCNQSQFDIA